MTETTSLLDIIIYNIAAPLIISSIAIWIVTDNRRLSFSKMMSKMNEKTKEMMR